MRIQANTRKKKYRRNQTRRVNETCECTKIHATRRGNRRCASKQGKTQKRIYKRKKMRRVNETCQRDVSTRDAHRSRTERDKIWKTEQARKKENLLRKAQARQTLHQIHSLRHHCRCKQPALAHLVQQLPPALLPLLRVPHHHLLTSCACTFVGM